MAADGLCYLCVQGGVTTPPVSFPAGGGSIPLPVQNGKWVKGVGGAAVWASITQQDVTLTPYGTSLPASPFDGQEAILVDSVTAPGYQWRFRYNAGSTSSYKWEYIGGSPLNATDSTAFAMPTGWNMAPLPTITVPRAGTYIIDSWLDWTTNGATAQGGFHGAGLVATAGAFGGSAAWIPATSNQGFPPNRAIQDLAAGAVLRHWIYAASTGCTAQTRRMAVIPVRVS